MSATAIAPAAFEERLARYVFERSEEARAVRVGEKETSEQAAIVARYVDLFTREQHAALRGAEEEAEGDERERLFRLREACEGGIVAPSWRGRRTRSRTRSSVAASASRGRSCGCVPRRPGWP